MKFRIIDTSDGSNVLGGDVSIDNAAIVQGLEEIIQYSCDNLKIKSLTELNVNEFAICRFRSCGTTGTYKVLRVE